MNLLTCWWKKQWRCKTVTKIRWWKYKSTQKFWKHTTREEFLAFLGIVTSMGYVRKGSMKEYWNKLIGHKIHHHFQLFLCAIESFSCRQLFIFHRLGETVQNYKKFKQLFNILVSSFKNIMSLNSRFLLMKVWLVLKVGDLQSNICQTSITTDLDSSCSLYAKVQLTTCIVFPYTKAKIKIAVNIVCLMIYV